MTGRYHGVGDWPPSPFRLFQALVAGAYGARWVIEPNDRKDAAFEWLERLGPPWIASPPAIPGRAVRSFVPNNDLDAVGGDPRRIAEVRSSKDAKPVIVSDDAPFRYIWSFDENHTGIAEEICRLSERLHTLGRGIDSAFASGLIADWEETIDHLRAAGRLSSPSPSAEENRNVRCPGPGSLRSLKTRYQQWRRQLGSSSTDAAATLFRQPPRARCRIVAYDRPPFRQVFDIRPSGEPDTFRRLPLTRAFAVATAVRDVALQRLSKAFPNRAKEIEQVIVARDAPAPAARRVRFVPLPSVGFRHTDASIRRILVEVPPDCPVPPRDVVWALAGQSLSGFQVVNEDTGETVDAMLIPSSDTRMLWHYGFGQRARVWRSVTPVALPVLARDRRTGSAKKAWEGEVTRRALNALRHAGLPYTGVELRIQREPFLSRGVAAADFADGRFGASRLHHLEIRLPEPVNGPVIVGDGRWLGLGLMMPVEKEASSVHLFRLSGGLRTMNSASQLIRALRRAVMSRVSTVLNARELSTFFTGHGDSDAPVRGASHSHLFYLAHDVDDDGAIDSVAIVAPHLADRTSDPSITHRDRRVLADALEGLGTLRAGALGVLTLRRETALPEAIFGRSDAWESLTLYRPTRHPKGTIGVEQAIARDLKVECARRGLPSPEVTVLEVQQGPRGGLRCRARLEFSAPIAGPVMLGAGSHFGEGLFGAAT